MFQSINIEKAIDEIELYTLIDVRSPIEFEKGHIPNAVNLPLFTDAERALIGTAYKQQSKTKAIEIGIESAKPKQESFLKKAKELHQGKGLLINCWRGGMRSAETAKFLTQSGLENISVVNNGYKSYRRIAKEYFRKPLKLQLLGGYTGSGKTEILQKMGNLGFQVVNLERLAKHKGSAFGWIGEQNQPSTEQFENLLYWKMKQFDPNKPIWLEDESRNLGSVYLPEQLFLQMRNSPVIFLDIPREIRAEYLAKTYGKFSDKDGAIGINKISKRLGGLATQQALCYLDKKDYKSVAMIVLSYYDKSYKRGVSKRKANLVYKLKLSATDVQTNYKIITEAFERQKSNTTDTI